MIAPQHLPHARPHGIDNASLTSGEAIELLLSAQIELLGRPAAGGDHAPQGRLPAVKTLSEFDSTFQPSTGREQTPRASTSWASSTAART